MQDIVYSSLYVVHYTLCQYIVHCMQYIKHCMITLYIVCSTLYIVCSTLYIICSTLYGILTIYKGHYTLYIAFNYQPRKGYVQGTQCTSYEIYSKLYRLHCAQQAVRGTSYAAYQLKVVHLVQLKEYAVRRTHSGRLPGERTNNSCSNGVRYPGTK